MSRNEQIRLVDLHPRDCAEPRVACLDCPQDGEAAASGGAGLADQPWLRAAQDAWGLCGVAVLHGADMRGHVLVCPAVNVPMRGPYAREGASADAAVLMRWCLGTGPLAGDSAVAQRLLEHLAAEMSRRGLAGLEVAASRARPTCTRPSAAWLADHGFRPLREGPTTVTMRLDLRSTCSWRKAWAAQVARARQLLVSAAPSPAPGMPPAGRRLAR